jgi:hypothetical protein
MLWTYLWSNFLLTRLPAGGSSTAVRARFTSQLCTQMIALSYWTCHKPRFPCLCRGKPFVLRITASEWNWTISRLPQRGLSWLKSSLVSADLATCLVSSFQLRRTEYWGHVAILPRGHQIEYPRIQSDDFRCFFPGCIATWAWSWLTTRLQQVPMSRKVELYLHSLLCLHVMVLQ